GSLEAGVSEVKPLRVRLIHARKFTHRAVRALDLEPARLLTSLFPARHVHMSLVEAQPFGRAVRVDRMVIALNRMADAARPFGQRHLAGEKQANEEESRHQA